MHTSKFFGLGHELLLSSLEIVPERLITTESNFATQPTDDDLRFVELLNKVVDGDGSGRIDSQVLVLFLMAGNRQPSF